MDALKNAWYAAGWVSDAANGKISRVISGQPILCFQRADKSWAAISNRCPHRFAPLDAGRIIGDAVQCGYHGLRFDGTGQCVHNPIGNGQIPQAARIASFPVAERYGMVWVWLGGHEAADPDTIPDYAVLDDPDWVHATGGYLLCEANYQLVVDNLMDLSHVAFLHPLLGNEHMSTGKLDVVERGGTVYSKLSMPNVPVPAFLAFHFGADAFVDNWLDMRWDAPSCMLLDFGATHVGKPRADGHRGFAYHILTPETETTTHYFFGISRKRAPGAEEAVREDLALQKSIFTTEDKPMLESCQRLMGTTDLWSLNPLLLSGDAGAVRVRRLLANRLSEERA